MVEIVLPDRFLNTVILGIGLVLAIATIYILNGTRP
jgi:hypothetical protein